MELKQISSNKQIKGFSVILEEAQTGAHAEPDFKTEIDNNTNNSNKGALLAPKINQSSNQLSKQDVISPQNKKGKRFKKFEYKDESSGLLFPA